MNGGNNLIEWERFLLWKMMKHFTYVIQYCPHSHVYVGSVPGLPGAHSQGATLDELKTNMQEVIEMLQEDHNIAFETDFVGTQNIAVSA